MVAVFVHLTFTNIQNMIILAQIYKNMLKRNKITECLE